ncbi:MAG: hypothetical protein A2005_11250 [Desulfuromonadales bacterium GWC2_61_20]|nr:MAG: hypothetical protein A2005_11250 [Desulfuromonadales bacterium GWC2_61_20]
MLLQELGKGAIPLVAKLTNFSICFFLKRAEFAPHFGFERLKFVLVRRVSSRLGEERSSEVQRPQHQECK